MTCETNTERRGITSISSNFRSNEQAYEIGMAQPLGFRFYHFQQLRNSFVKMSAIPITIILCLPCIADAIAAFHAAAKRFLRDHIARLDADDTCGVLLRKSITTTASLSHDADSTASVRHIASFDYQSSLTSHCR